MSLRRVIKLILANLNGAESDKYKLLLLEKRNACCVLLDKKQQKVLLSENTIKW